MPTGKKVIDSLWIDREVTVWFFEVVGAAICGAAEWKKARSSKKWTTFVSASCEAFGLLVLENNYETWKVAAANKTKSKDNKDEVPKPLYTIGGNCGGKNLGYSERGKERFRELMKLVKERRALDKKRQEKIEDAAKKKWTEAGTQGSRAKKGRGQEDSLEDSVAQNEMIDTEAWGDNW